MHPHDTTEKFTGHRETSNTLPQNRKTAFTTVFHKLLCSPGLVRLNSAFGGVCGGGEEAGAGHSDMSMDVCDSTRVYAKGQVSLDFGHLIQKLDRNRTTIG